MHIVHPDVEKYVDKLWDQQDPILAEMEDLAAENDFPIIGRQVGRFLHILAASMGAKNILELGSGYGYSAYWFARALPAGGKVVCTDTDRNNRDKALAWFTRAGMTEKIRFELGGALEAIENIPGPFDIVFNDIDKEDYAAAIEPAYERLRPGGLFITDNALWYGKIADPENADETTRGVLEFNKKLFAHPGFESVVLPVRDGLAVAMKK